MALVKRSLSVISSLLQARELLQIRRAWGHDLSVFEDDPQPVDDERQREGGRGGKQDAPRVGAPRAARARLGRASDGP